MEIQKLKYQIITFDLDGVLIDSLVTMKTAWSEVQKEFKTKIKFDDYQSLIGIPFEEIIKKLNNKILVDNLENVKDLYFMNTKKNENLINIYKNVKEILSYLREKKIKVAIITSKIRKNTENICIKFNIKPDYIICADDVKYGKPNPESGIKLLKISKIESSKIVYIGDMLVDNIFALNCKFDFIYANYGYEKKINELSSGTKVINNIIELKKFI